MFLTQKHTEKCLFFNITFQYNNIQKEFQSALNVLLATYKVTKTEHTRGFDATVSVS